MENRSGPQSNRTGSHTHSRRNTRVSPTFKIPVSFVSDAAAHCGAHGIVSSLTAPSSVLLASSSVTRRRDGHHQHTMARSHAIQLTRPMGRMKMQRSSSGNGKGLSHTTQFFSHFFPHPEQQTITAPYTSPTMSKPNEHVIKYNGKLLNSIYI